MGFVWLLVVNTEDVISRADNTLGHKVSFAETFKVDSICLTYLKEEEVVFVGW